MTFIKDPNIKIAIWVGVAIGVVSATAYVGKKQYDKRVISDAMFKSSARKLGVDEAFLRAIAEKEGGGKGFYVLTGKPVVRMENHILDRYYASKGSSFDAGSMYGANRSGSSEYDRFLLAYKDNPEAAIYSTSFGAFQIMGFNAIPIGYKTLKDFFTKMSTSANDQFEAMVKFIQWKNLVPYIKDRDYNGFAKIYNGSTAYAQGSNGLAALHQKWLNKLT